MIPGTLVCPQCGRHLASIPGASHVRCFGCQHLVPLARGAGVAAGTPTSSRSTKLPWVLAGSLLLAAVMVALLGAGAYLLMARSPATPAAAQATSPAPDAVPNPVPNPGTNPGAPATEPAAPDPDLIVTEEERKLARRVNPQTREEILRMWNQLIGSTRKKILAPKNSVVRLRTEGLLSAIEEAELGKMAVLLQVEEEELRAVIRVDQARQAGIEP